MGYWDLNNVQFYDIETNKIGDVTRIAVDGTNALFSGTVSQVDGNGEQVILLLDRYRRFLASAKMSDNGSWNISLPLAKLANLSPNAPVKVYRFSPAENVALRLDLPVETVAVLEQAMKKCSPNGPGPGEAPSFSDKLKSLIIDATSCKYVSRSNRDCILTGNNYQTLDLGDVLRMGGRPERTNMVATIDFEGKKVLDIGANTGEISRYIRRLGAALVDGYEYDSFFVETGRMINAYTGITRVSLFQGDATNPHLYSEKYDIVVALAVYVYIKDVLDKIAQITDVMLFETHTLGHGLEFYLEKVLPYFPCYHHLGYTDLHKEFTNSRALLLFAKSEALLDKYIKNEYLLLPKDDTLDTYASRQYAPESFFMTYGNCRKSDLSAIIARLEKDYSGVEFSKLKEEEIRFRSRKYLAMFLLGFSDYERNGNKVDANNRFARFFEKVLEFKLIPDMTYLLTDKQLLYRKIEHKYKDFTHAKNGNFRAIPPLLIKPCENGVFEFKTQSGDIIRANNIDGHHRLFLAWLFGNEKIMFYDGGQKMVSGQKKIATHYTLAG